MLFLVVGSSACKGAPGRMEPWRPLKSSQVPNGNSIADSLTPELAETVQDPEPPQPTAEGTDIVLTPETAYQLPQSTPTPDPTRLSPALRADPLKYVVRKGDTLSKIAYRFGVPAERIQEENQIPSPDLISVGQELTIPSPEPYGPGPSLKILPNSELVYGPVAASFDVEAELGGAGSALSLFTEVINDQEMNGLEIVQLVAERYSVNAQVLLAVLEYQHGWLTKTSLDEDMQTYPVGYRSAGRRGMYNQLAWAAQELNLGYYRWRSGWAGPYKFTSGGLVNPGPGINAGTAGVQNLFAKLYDPIQWWDVVGEGGFLRTFSDLFGDPFLRAFEPLVPQDLKQPVLQLPFRRGVVWHYSGGPHAAWGRGSAWGGLDFSSPGDSLGCVRSDAWVVASADGLILRSRIGEVMQDLDGDGNEGTGWAILYMHIETRHRVEAGTYVHAGDRLGHPSCEGGVSTGTHVHLARKYNGEWISADGLLPFNLDGWISAGWGDEYDGTLKRGGVTLTACECKRPDNSISR